METGGSDVEAKRKPWPGLLVLFLSTFVTVLDLTVVNGAIPTLLVSLQASLDQILWVVNAYLLTFASCSLPRGGWATSLVSAICWMPQAQIADEMIPYAVPERSR